VDVRRVGDLGFIRHGLITKGLRLENGPSGPSAAPEAATLRAEWPQTLLSS
jgi:hypothetical protein